MKGFLKNTCMLWKKMRYFNSKAPYCLGIQINQSPTGLFFAPLLKHTINNIGDPFEGRGGHLTTFDSEIEIVKIMSKWLDLDPKDAWGYCNPGSTYSNIHAIHIEIQRVEELGDEKPIIIIAENAHYSLPKSALITRTELHCVKTNQKGQMDPDSLESIINIYPNRHFIFVFCSGSVAEGAYDDVEKLLAVIKKSNLSRNQYFIHCDAALGGMITPFISDGAAEKKLSFLTEEIDSMSISFHKILGSPIPCSVLIVRKHIIDSIKFPKIDYVKTLDKTIGGSRDGFTPYVVHSILENEGFKGIKKKVESILNKAEQLSIMLEDNGISAWRNSYSPCIILPKLGSSDFMKKYYLPEFNQNGNSFTHVFTMPQLTRSVMKEFVKDYKNELRGTSL